MAFALPPASSSYLLILCISGVYNTYLLIPNTYLLPLPLLPLYLHNFCDPNNIENIVYVFVGSDNLEFSFVIIHESIHICEVTDSFRIQIYKF